ncbi:unnamed protein product [Caenorhabditis sp. 36 PRJEB53466]|nr:unnamed protein product [Caenorhabditis sp. 36 PRJEB53466]
MKLTLAFILLAMLIGVLARPQYKEIDYKMYNDDEGVAVDAVYEVVGKPPDAKHHHHHHNHKKLAKSNHLDRLKRYLRGFD